jgi:hypothetical protein
MRRLAGDHAYRIFLAILLTVGREIAREAGSKTRDSRLDPLEGSDHPGRA